MLLVLVATTGNISLANASQCEVTGSTENVVIVVCSPSADQAAWQAVGEQACSEANGICNVWIWDDIEKAPTEAPVSDSDMSKDLTSQAVAIWVNDSKNLVVIKQTDQSG